MAGKGFGKAWSNPRTTVPGTETPGSGHRGEPIAGDFLSWVKIGLRFAGAAAIVGVASLVWAVSPPILVQIEAFSPYYSPQKVTVLVGTPILWENPTATHHTITHDGCRAEGLCAFDSGPIAPNGRFGLYHLPPGRYHYHCSLHPIMRGVLIILDSPEFSTT